MDRSARIDPSTYRCEIGYDCPLSELCLSIQSDVRERPKILTLKKSELIYRNGSDRKNAYVVLSGILSMTALAHAEPVIMGLFGRGSALGETEALEAKSTGEYLFECFTDCRICKIPAKAVRTIVQMRPELYIQLLNSTHRNYEIFMRHIWVLSAPSLHERLMRFFISIGDFCPREKGYLVLNATQEHIAKAIGSERSTVSHTLSKMQDNGLIELTYRKILLKQAIFDVSADSSAYPFPTWESRQSEIRTQA